MNLCAPLLLAHSASATTCSWLWNQLFSGRECTISCGCLTAFCLQIKRPQFCVRSADSFPGSNTTLTGMAHYICGGLCQQDRSTLLSISIAAKVNITAQSVMLSVYGSCSNDSSADIQMLSKKMEHSHLFAPGITAMQPAKLSCAE